MRHCFHAPPDPRCDVCRRYDADDPPGYRAFSDATAVKLRGPRPAPKRFDPPRCPHFGERLGGPCGAALHRCTLDGAKVTRFGGCADAARSCSTCTLRPPPGPLAGHFNASLCEWGGRLLLASRHGWRGSKIYLTELAPDLTPLAPPRELRLPHPRAAGGREDPRLAVVGDKLVLAFVGVETAKTVLTHQMFAELGPDLKVSRVWHPQYEFRTYPKEKSWSPFEGPSGELLAVYSVEPHVVLRCDVPAAAEVARTSAGLRWGWGQVRGGAPPVPVGGEWYHWFHSRRDPAPGSGGNSVYTMGLYTFSAEPPYRVLRWTPEPVVVAPPGEENPHAPGLAVVFPCGAALRGGEWVVSAGWMDREVRYFRYPAAEVEARLRPVR